MLCRLQQLISLITHDSEFPSLLGTMNDEYMSIYASSVKNISPNLIEEHIKTWNLSLSLAV
jgi:hypothetical protein